VSYLISEQQQLLLLFFCVCRVIAIIYSRLKGEAPVYCYYSLAPKKNNITRQDLLLFLDKGASRRRNPLFDFHNTSEIELKKINERKHSLALQINQIHGIVAYGKLCATGKSKMRKQLTETFFLKIDNFLHIFFFSLARLFFFFLAELLLLRIAGLCRYTTPTHGLLLERW
jgi:hypothetical protein